MSEPHRIRLRGHWEVDGDRRIRRFGKPRLPDAAERVWLVIDGEVGQVPTVELNGFPLDGAGAGLRWDVTGLLRERNVLALAGGEANADVRLEIG